MAGSASVPTAATVGTVRKVVKPSPAELMEDTGTGLDYGTRPDRMRGYLTPNDRFFVRSHAPTPRLDATTWTLQVTGNGVDQGNTQPESSSWNELGYLHHSVVAHPLPVRGA